VPGSIGYDRARNRAVFTPAVQLSAGKYTATVGALDEWGNPMTPFTWSFSASDVVTTGAGRTGGTTVTHAQQPAPATTRRETPARRSVLAGE
jgi:hypothetical protein